jgi:hypothetical protein
MHLFYAYGIRTPPLDNSPLHAPCLYAYKDINERDKDILSSNGIYAVSRERAAKLALGGTLVIKAFS